MVRVKNAEGLVLEKEKDLPVILPEAWVDTLQNKNLLQELACSQKNFEGVLVETGLEKTIPTAMLEIFLEESERKLDAGI